MDSFTSWLMDQTDRQDSIGDFAVDVKVDSGWPEEATFEERLDYLDLCNASEEAVDAFQNAWDEFRSNTGDLLMGRKQNREKRLDELDEGVSQNESAAPERKKVLADQEAWVNARIRTAIRAALAVQKEHRVGADSRIIQYAIRGIVQGTAAQIIDTLGMVPSYVNIPKMPEETVR